MLTILLAKVFGIFLVIVGIATVLRRHYLIPVIATFATESLTRFVMALIELMAGLFLVVSHNNWSSVPAGIISALGWIAVIESTAYMVMPDEMFAKILRAFNNPTWYVAGGLISIALGLYLAGYGFGLF